MSAGPRFVRRGARVTQPGSRRGATAVEFALLLPIFLIGMMGIFEFSWYFFQRHAVGEAARLGCRAATRIDPRFDDIVAVSQDRILMELQRLGGVDCGAVSCSITIIDRSGDVPARLQCDVVAGYRSLSGFLSEGGGGVGLAQEAYGVSARSLTPRTLRGRAVAVLENAR